MGCFLIEFRIVEVPELLIQYSASEDASALGSGPAFASQHVENANDLTYHDIRYVDEPLRQRVLVFDAWVRNGDRILGHRGGNVNLLWQPAEQRLHVFDHNNAFEANLMLLEFCQNHVFQGILSQKDNELAVAIEAEMDDILTIFRSFTDPLPEEWLERIEDLPDFSIEGLEAIVSDYRKAVDLLRDLS
jgi:hypothetical protein